MSFTVLSRAEEWDDLFGGLEFVERRFRKWGEDRALAPRQLEAVLGRCDELRAGWQDARREGRDAPAATGLPPGRQGESPASRSLRYWWYVEREVARHAEAGALTLAQSHALGEEARERQAALERRV